MTSPLDEAQGRLQFVLYNLNYCKHMCEDAEQAEYNIEQMRRELIEVKRIINNAHKELKLFNETESIH